MFIKNRSSILLFLLFFLSIEPATSASATGTLESKVSSSYLFLFIAVFVLFLCIFLFRSLIFKNKSKEETGQKEERLALNLKSKKREDEEAALSAFIKKTGKHFHEKGYAVLYTGQEKGSEQGIIHIIATKGESVLLTHCSVVKSNEEANLLKQIAAYALTYIEKHFGATNKLHFTTYLCKPKPAGENEAGIEPIELQESTNKDGKKLPIKILSL